jgi:hypothetical protein
MSGTKKPAILWHYTVGRFLPLIVQDGIIKADTGMVPKGERPAVWFSANQTWEETANKMHMTPFGPTFGTRETTHKLAGGLVRIGVHPDTAPYGWSAFVRLSGIKIGMARGLE